MRVYEFAREYNMMSKEVVSICLELGVEVKAQSKLNHDQLEQLRHRLGEPKALVEVKTTKVAKTKVKETPIKVKKEQQIKVNKQVAYIVSECEPFTTLGELGKKSTEFIKQTKKQGHTPVILLPLYSTIKDAYENKLEWLMDIPVRMGCKDERASVYRLEKNKVMYLFIENDFYFNREEIYGYEDDIARFTFFSRSILEALPLIGKPIYDIYLNDWHTSIFALLLKTDYNQHPYYKQMKTILNIHDLQHQGWCEVATLSDVLGIGEGYYENGLTRMGDAVNLLKSGIETADEIQLTKTSEAQMQLPEIVRSGMKAVLESNLLKKRVS